MSPKPSPVPDGYTAVTPYLIVTDPDAVLDFVVRAFGGEVTERHLDDSGGVMHAEVRVDGAPIMLGGASEEWPPTRSLVHLYVPDADAVFRAAVEAGGKVLREPETMAYGDRTGGVEDAWGTQWWIATRVARASETPESD
jgi:PhnB protein